MPECERPQTGRSKLSATFLEPCSDSGSGSRIAATGQSLGGGKFGFAKNLAPYPAIEKLN